MLLGSSIARKATVATQRLKFRARLPPFDSAEPRKDAIEPGERGPRFVGRINDQWQFPVPAGAINPARDRCRHWSKERLRPECCVANRGVAATAACFRIAALNQAKR